MSVKRSNFALDYVKAASHANHGVEKNLAWSSAYISRHMFWKLLNASASNNVSFWTNKSWNYHKLLILKSLKLSMYS